MSNKELNREELAAFLSTLEQRFQQNTHRHSSVNWKDVSTKLSQNPSKTWSLYQMEINGGEPDVILFEENSDKFYFVDCASESPKERRSLCYDRKGLDARKEFKPENTAVDKANEMGVELLNETQYRFLQTVEEFDLKTSSWLKAPDSIRKLGGAIFGDRRFNHVFIYHNGASS